LNKRDSFLTKTAFGGAAYFLGGGIFGKSAALIFCNIF
jgi:hypothetical protein